jgi:hypothetical protein
VNKNASGAARGTARMDARGLVRMDAAEARHVLAKMCSHDRDLRLINSQLCILPHSPIAVGVMSSGKFSLLHEARLRNTVENAIKKCVVSASSF